MTFCIHSRASTTRAEFLTAWLLLSPEQMRELCVVWCMQTLAVENHY